MFSGVLMNCKQLFSAKLCSLFTNGPFDQPFHSKLEGGSAVFVRDGPEPSAMVLPHARNVRRTHPTGEITPMRHAEFLQDDGRCALRRL